MKIHSCCFSIGGIARVGFKPGVAAAARRKCTVRTFENWSLTSVSARKPPLTDIHPSLRIIPAEHWTAEIDWDFFWRQSAADGLYLLNDQLLHPANGTDTSYVGSQPRAELTWQIDRHLSLDGAYEYFWSGPFLHQSPPDRDINYCYVRMTYKF